MLRGRHNRRAIAGAECFDDFDCAYDALLDDYDPGLTAGDVAPLFDELKRELKPMIATLSAKPIDDSCLRGSFPVERQREFLPDVLSMMGFDPQSWRLDDSVHPFSTGMGAEDTADVNSARMPSVAMINVSPRATGSAVARSGGS